VALDVGVLWRDRRAWRWMSAFSGVIDVRGAGCRRPPVVSESSMVMQRESAGDFDAVQQAAHAAPEQRNPTSGDRGTKIAHKSMHGAPGDGGIPRWTGEAIPLSSRRLFIDAFPSSCAVSVGGARFPYRERLLPG